MAKQSHNKMAHDHRSYSDHDLTKNQNLVMRALSSADGPLSAYSILDELRDEGFRAPLQVYRALEKLMEMGIVHRLESLNAFVACTHPNCDTHETTAFMICDKCGNVTEISNDPLAKELTKIADKSSFVLKKSTIELRGLCAPCQ